MGIKSQTGEKPVTWEYFDEMHDILFDKPEINPPALASNIEGYRKRLYIEKKKETCNKSNDDKKDDEEEEENSKSGRSTNKRRRISKKSSIDLFREEARLRHEENIERKNTFLSLLKKLVEKKN